MVALAKSLLDRFGRFWHHSDAQDVEPVRDNGNGSQPRPMVGLYAQLSPEQRERARAFNGVVRSGRSDLPTVSERR